MSFAPAIVDQYGDINLHAQEGATILINLPGVTAETLAFKIEGQADLALTATGNPDEYKLVIPQAVVDAMTGTTTAFAMLYIGDAVPVVWWEGVIRKRGF